jgi:hypothetical protein
MDVSEGGAQPEIDAAPVNDGEPPTDGSGSNADAPPHTASDGAVQDSTAAEGAAPGDAGAKDAGHADSAPPPVTKLVQSGAVDQQNTKTLSLPVQPIGAGHLVVVLAIYDDTNQSVTSVSDGTSSRYVSANVLSTDGECQQSEIWYASGTAAGGTSVTVNTTDTVHLSIWVMEVSGLLQGGRLDAHPVVVNSAPQAAVINVPPIAPASVPAFVVAAVGSCQTLGLVGPPFSNLAVEHGNGGAYVIAPTGGSYGPSFANQLATWNASMVDFL